MKDDEGNTLLMVATKCGFKDILNEFLEHGIDINHQNVLILYSVLLNISGGREYSSTSGSYLPAF